MPVIKKAIKAMKAMIVKPMKKMMDAMKAMAKKAQALPLVIMDLEEGVVEVEVDIVVRVQVPPTATMEQVVHSALVVATLNEGTCRAGMSPVQHGLHEVRPWDMPVGTAISRTVVRVDLSDD